jgi:hypothetical protein
MKAVNFGVYSAVAQIFCNQSVHYVAATHGHFVTMYIVRRDTG